MIFEKKAEKKPYKINFVRNTTEKTLAEKKYENFSKGLIRAGLFLSKSFRYK